MHIFFQGGLFTNPPPPHTQYWTASHNTEGLHVLVLAHPNFECLTLIHFASASSQNTLIVKVKISSLTSNLYVSNQWPKILKLWQLSGINIKENIYIVSVKGFSWAKPSFHHSRLNSVLFVFPKCLFKSTISSFSFWRPEMLIWSTIYPIILELNILEQELRTLHLERNSSIKNGSFRLSSY